ncbi:HyuE hydantoin racemase [Roseobacter sp. AzwK-3b]|uniref:aspartate/glutamate racemase family protein n=1 Tax=Roseobacter sp. AzwK-3b TaxID=351016 RepID=UPI0001569368|nr:aspartate/glutamate racemase family protein [Roseobacter sp. AzwK-3b]EDM72108.1 HyuE hydantoin racemase [Roseobacter sp. AzwK-3b]
MTTRTAPRIAILNPNSTQRMTDEMVTSARSAIADMAEVIGLTNRQGPASIQGPEDAERCLEGLFAVVEEARGMGVDAIVIGCFDDTGLATLRATAGVPVIGMGEAGCIAGSLAATSFAVVTSLDVAVPVISENIRVMRLEHRCAGVHASGVPVLELNEGADSLRRVQAGLDRMADLHPGCSIVLGCGGMTTLAHKLRAPGTSRVIDPVVAAVHMCLAALA